MSRFVACILGVATCLLVWLSMRNIDPGWTAYLAAALATIHPILLFWSRFGLRESMAGLLFIAGLCLVANSKGKKWGARLFLAGFLLTLGTGDAVWAGVLWPLVLLAHSILSDRKRDNLDFPFLSSLLAMIALALFFSEAPILIPISLSVLAIGGFAAVASGRSPLAFLKEPKQLQVLAGASGAVFASILRYTFCPAQQAASRGFDALYEATAPDPLSFSVIPVLIAASIGFGWSLAYGKKEHSVWLSYAALAVILAVFCAGKDEATTAAAVPILCIFAAIGIHGLGKMLVDSFKLVSRFRYTPLVLAAVMVVFPLIQSIELMANLSKGTTPDAAVEWVERTVPEGSVVAVERGLLALPAKRFATLYVEKVGENPPEFYADRGIEYLVASVENILEAQRQSAAMSSAATNYSRLMDAAKYVAAIESGDELAGPKILLIALDRTWLPNRDGHLE